MASKALPRPRIGLASFEKAHIQTVAVPAQILTSYVLRSNLLQQQVLVQNGTTAAFRNRRAREALVVAPVLWEGSSHTRGTAPFVDLIKNSLAANDEC